MEKQKSRKEQSKLIKLGIKSVFTHKLFTILMMILIFISGTTYTLLVSSSSSFKKSYNNVVNYGNLHEYVIKENYKARIGSTKVIEIYDPQSSTNIPAIDANIEKVAKANKDAKGNYHIKYNVTTKTGDYASLDVSLLSKEYIVSDNGDSSFADELNKFKDNLKSYESFIEYRTEQNLSDTFVEELRKPSNDPVNPGFGDKAFFNNNKSISVEAGKNAFNIVKYNSDTKINKMFIYDGTDKITEQLSSDQMIDQLKSEIGEVGNNVDDYTFDTTKGFRAYAKNQTGQSITVTDPSSYQAIISPGYANRNGKASISPSEFLQIYFTYKSLNRNIMDEVADENSYGAVVEKYRQNLIWVDKTPYFIVGIGTTPDYLYPIVNQSHPVINVKDQATLFVNKRGYERVYDAFRTNPVEEYISMKFKPEVSNTERAIIISQINNRAHSRSGYPRNIDMVTSAFDKNDQLLLAQERVSFLKELTGTIDTISYVTTSLLVLFVAAIVILVFRMIISMDRKILATQLALGYSKVNIALVKAFGALFMVGVPVFIAYIVGYFMQFWFIGEFDNYWTIPTWGTTFSWTALVVAFVIPITLIFALIMIITLWTMRLPLINLLKGNDDHGSSLVAKVLSKFKVIGVKGRYALALAAKNSFKLFLVTVASIVSISTLMVGISSIGKAEQAYTSTINASKYEFAVDLFTPTEQGGKYEEIYKTDLRNQYTINGHIAKRGIPHDMDARTGSIVSSSPEWHMPSTKDANVGMAATAASNLSEASKYLRYKIQTKPLLDKSVASMNPWEIAKKLMPDNQKNAADQNADEMGYKKVGATSWNDFVNHWRSAEEKNANFIPYLITYGVVIKNHGDENYTYLSTRFKDNNFKIYGVDENTSMLSFKSSLNSINDYKGNNIPILINHYISEKYDLKNGSVVPSEIFNGYHRMERGREVINSNLEVVGIVDGYDEKGIYTSKRMANKTLDMPTDSFNGVFTKQKNPTLLGTLPLYSPSGIWMGTDTIVGNWENVLSNMLKDTNVWSDHNSKKVAKDTNEFFSKFSRTPFVGATSTVQWNEMSKFTFKNISHLSNFMVSLVEFIAISLSIIFTIVIAYLLLSSNRKKIATLWTMGYRKSEISKIFLSTYIIPIIFSISISIPISLAVLAGMKSFIMGFGNILIPFTLDWFAPFLAIIAVSGIFVISTLLSINTLKQEKALEAFIGD